MNKQTTRAFSAGIFLSALILLGFSFYPGTEEDPRDILEAEGYIILTEQEAQQHKQELSKLQSQVDELSQQSQTETNDVEVTDSSQKELSLTVSPGMTSKEISEELESSGIIRNASDLNGYLAKSGLAEKIQIGEYQFRSDMTLEEISQILTQ